MTVMRAVAVGGVLGIAAVLVALTLQTPAVPTYAPTPPQARDAGRSLVGPILYTVDASAPEVWRYFSFRLGSIVETPGPRGWDLAFRRYSIIAGDGVGIRDLGVGRLEDVRSVAATGYVANEDRGEPRNPAIASWYQYGFFSHVLTPKPHVWAVRTADGHYAKLEMVGYYCPGARPGCPTFRYVYQGDGSTVVDASAARTPSPSLLRDARHRS
jgi:heme-binding HmuY-like protein